MDSVHSSSVKIKALNNGETEVRVRAVGTDVVASNYVKVKVKATSFSVGFMEYSHKYGCYKWYDVSPYYSYETTQNSPLNLAFDFKPEITYVDDAEVVIEDDRFAHIKEDGSDIIAGEITGDTRISITLPYSNLKTSFTLNVKKFLYDTGINLIKQGQDYFNISFGGRIYSRVKDDIYIVDNIILYDNVGRILASTMNPTEKIQIFRNGTSDVGFSTPMINLTQIYGYLVINNDFYDFLPQCYFYVTFRKPSTGEYLARFLYLDEHNWQADYQY